MAESNVDDVEHPRRHRMPDLVTLAVGLVALAVSATALVGDTSWLPDIDVLWLLSGPALVIGMLLLVSSLFRRRG